MATNTITPAQIKSLENKSKAGWKMYFMMKEKHEEMAEFVQYVKKANHGLAEIIKRGGEPDITHLKNQFIELYDKVNSQMECPVCFEVLTKDILEVPNCGHLICKGCKGTICNTTCQCPVCKKKYYVPKN